MRSNIKSASCINVRCGSWNFNSHVCSFLSINWSDIRLGLFISHTCVETVPAVYNLKVLLSVLSLFWGWLATILIDIESFAAVSRRRTPIATNKPTGYLPRGLSAVLGIACFMAITYVYCTIWWMHQQYVIVFNHSLIIVVVADGFAHVCRQAYRSMRFQECRAHLFN